jgi:hypothetical protein
MVLLPDSERDLDADRGALAGRPRNGNLAPKEVDPFPDAEQPK